MLGDDSARGVMVLEFSSAWREKIKQRDEQSKAWFLSSVSKRQVEKPDTRSKNVSSTTPTPSFHLQPATRTAEISMTKTNAAAHHLLVCRDPKYLSTAQYHTIISPRRRFEVLKVFVVSFGKEVTHNCAPHLPSDGSLSTYATQSTISIFSIMAAMGRKRRRCRIPAMAALAFTRASTSPFSSALYVGEQSLSSPPAALYQQPEPAPSAEPSIANVGGTLPERVVMKFESEQADPMLGGPPSTRGRQDSFYWLDRLDDESCAMASDQWHGRTLLEEGRNSAESRPNTRPFSILSWNILSQSLYKNALYSWDVRFKRIMELIAESSPTIVCLQEVESYASFLDDFLPAMQALGYDGTSQGHTNVREIKRRSGKLDRRHLTATFWKADHFRPINVTDYNGMDYPHMARGRSLTSCLQDISSVSNSSEAASGPCLSVINCHLEGHPRQYAARMTQLQHAMEDLSQRRTRGPDLNGLVISGDFNCELQSSACSTYLRIGRVGRKGGLGGVHGTSALAVPASLLESEEAAEVLSPLLEWGLAIPNDDLEQVKPHPFRRNSMMSAYPVQLGQRDPRLHFTYCSHPDRPVAGLDQLWHSSFTLSRIGLRKMFPSQKIRKLILKTGLPTSRHPSDHLPIGAVFDWNCDVDACMVDTRTQTCQEVGFKELSIVLDRPPPMPKPKSPMMAFAELDMLLSTCPYDTEEQREETVAIIEHVPDLPLGPKEKPSSEQLKKLGEMRNRKKLLLQNASDDTRQTLQRILKLSKETSGMY